MYAGVVVAAVTFVTAAAAAAGRLLIAYLYRCGIMFRFDGRQPFLTTIIASA